MTALLITSISCRTQEVADTVQCSVHTIHRLRNLWQKTGDVENLRGRAGRQKSLDESEVAGSDEDPYEVVVAAAESGQR